MEALGNNCGKFPGLDFDHNYIGQLGNWDLFEWAISFQVKLSSFIKTKEREVMLLTCIGSEYCRIFESLAYATYGYTIIHSYFSNIKFVLENLKFFGWTQLTCGFIELLWSSCVLLDMHYHSNDWRAYFTMCTVSWQFISIILISVKCPLLERIINGQRNQISAENSIAIEPSKLRPILNFEKQRSDKRKKRRKEKRLADITKDHRANKHWADITTISITLYMQTILAL
ncbi:unnamed protein product [Brugia pahangi]|uniref:7TM_GPCR_Srx domain-containing protein n=1 Tax=Brugia pahangi TaxID=6280 RepID=A0A0N4T631_BRUPA|nr:unnamed protein product [Brugia pahangi]